jgi:hypothetical protein
MVGHDFMPMNATRLLTPVIAFGFLASTVCTPGDEVSPRPPTQSELEGTWVGIGGRGIPLYRLTLEPGAKGLLASYDIRSPLLAWRITSWGCDGHGKVSIKFEVATQDTEALRGTGRAERLWMSDVLTLTTEVIGKTNSTERIVLRREREQARIAKEIQDWMQAYPSAGPTNRANGQPNGAANGSQPIRSDTNSKSGAAGSSR